MNEQEYWSNLYSCYENQILLNFQELNRPSTIYKPKIFIDGNKYCVLYGDNLQDGVAGFGDSPSEAFSNFDDNWFKILKTK